MYNYDNMLNKNLSRERHQSFLKDAQQDRLGKKDDRNKLEHKRVTQHMKRITLAMAQLFGK